ncbi:hypothetical protein [Microtetraspora fusca]|uniref:Uncharacterized protein n=1 Tax=Microtetraspora fusca TaxID=1997 RepID=A0ABW6V5C6_MICFU|nr:hypothetical protein [Microtetraspora fusca]
MTAAAYRPGTESGKAAAADAMTLVVIAEAPVMLARTVWARPLVVMAG